METIGINKDTLVPLGSVLALIGAIIYGTTFVNDLTHKIDKLENSVNKLQQVVQIATQETLKKKEFVLWKNQTQKKNPDWSPERIDGEYLYE